MEGSHEPNCVFCQTISGKLPSNKVYEDDECLAVLDIKPANLGHVLLLPKKHYQVMPQVPAGELAKLVTVAKKVSKAMLQSGIEGINIFVANGEAAGQRAPHVIIHIIPRTEGDGIDFKADEWEIGESHHIITADAPVFEMLADEEAANLFSQAVALCSELYQKGAAGTNILTVSGGPAGQKKAQAQIHVFARKKGDGRLSWKPKEADLEELAKVAEIYREAIINVKDMKEPEENYLLKQLRRTP